MLLPAGMVCAPATPVSKTRCANMVGALQAVAPFQQMEHTSKLLPATPDIAFEICRSLVHKAAKRKKAARKKSSTGHRAVELFGYQPAGKVQPES